MIVARCRPRFSSDKDSWRAADGHVYERTDLERWFSAGHETSPLTNAPMSVHVRADLTTRAYCAAWHD